MKNSTLNNKIEKNLNKYGIEATDYDFSNCTTNIDRYHVVLQREQDIEEILAEGESVEAIKTTKKELATWVTDYFMNGKAQTYYTQNLKHYMRKTTKYLARLKGIIEADENKDSDKRRSYHSIVTTRYI